MLSPAREKSIYLEKYWTYMVVLHNEKTKKCKLVVRQLGPRTGWVWGEKNSFSYLNRTYSLFKSLSTYNDIISSCPFPAVRFPLVFHLNLTHFLQRHLVLLDTLLVNSDVTSFLVSSANYSSRVKYGTFHPLRDTYHFYKVCQTHNLNNFCFSYLLICWLILSAVLWHREAVTSPDHSMGAS